MAEVRKKQSVKKYNIDKELEEKEEKSKKNTKSKNKNVDKKKETKKETKNNNSLWVRFRIFCHGVKSEFDKVVWPSKKDMVKYSIMTITFILFLSVYFYIIDIVFALILKLFS